MARNEVFSHNTTTSYCLAEWIIFSGPHGSCSDCMYDCCIWRIWVFNSVLWFWRKNSDRLLPRYQTGSDLEEILLKCFSSNYSWLRFRLFRISLSFVILYSFTSVITCLFPSAPNIVYYGFSFCLLHYSFSQKLFQGLHWFSALPVLCTVCGQLFGLQNGDS